MNVTYMDALSRRECSDEERCARFILAHAILLSFPGVPAIYIQSILGRVMITQVSKNLDIIVRLTVKKYSSKEITTELNNKATLRYSIYYVVAFNYTSSQS